MNQFWGVDADPTAQGRIKGEAGQIRFTRSAPGAGGAPADIQYVLAGDMFVRRAGAAPQRLLPGVQAARWRFLGQEGWVETWPISDEKADEWPRAVELELQVAGTDGPAGTLRRVIVLPAMAALTPPPTLPLVPQP